MAGDAIEPAEAPAMHGEQRTARTPRPDMGKDREKGDHEKAPATSRLVDRCRRVNCLL